MRSGIMFHPHSLDSPAKPGAMGWCRGLWVGAGGYGLWFDPCKTRGATAGQASSGTRYQAGLATTVIIGTIVIGGCAEVEPWQVDGRSAHGKAASPVSASRRRLLETVLTNATLRRIVSATGVASYIPEFGLNATAPSRALSRHEIAKECNTSAI